MRLKTDKNIVCEFCGHPIKYGFISIDKTIVYICSNGECSNGKKLERLPYDTFPEWVHMRLPKKIWSE